MKDKYEEISFNEWNPNCVGSYVKNGTKVTSRLDQYFETKTRSQNLEDLEELKILKEQWLVHEKELGDHFDKNQALTVRLIKEIKSVIHNYETKARKNPKKFYYGWFNVDSIYTFVFLTFRKTPFNLIKSLFGYPRKPTILYKTSVTHLIYLGVTKGF